MSAAVSLAVKDVGECSIYVGHFCDEKARCDRVAADSQRAEVGRKALRKMRERGFAGHVLVPDILFATEGGKAEDGDELALDEVCLAAAIWVRVTGFQEAHEGYESVETGERIDVQDVLRFFERGVPKLILDGREGCVRGARRDRGHRTRSSGVGDDGVHERCLGSDYVDGFLERFF